jgi:hypothetical protein
MHAPRYPVAVRLWLVGIDPGAILATDHAGVLDMSAALFPRRGDGTDWISEKLQAMPVARTSRVVAV